MVLKLGLQEQLSNHFFLRNLSSRNIPSILKVSLEITLEGMFSLTKTIILPPNSFQSPRKSDVKLVILNWPTGKDSLSLVSDITKM